MRNVIKWLIVLLVVQIGIVAWVNRPGDELDAFNATEPLFDFNADQVDRLVIEEQGKAALVLTKDGDQWLLPEKGNFPVSSKKIATFLGKLSAAKPSWPVGETLVAAKQLKVAEGEFERKIGLSTKGKVLEQIYLGSSPGFRKVHARLDGASHTYAIDFNAFDAPTNPADWYDGDLLHLVSADLKRIDMGAYALTRGEKGFEVEGLAADEQTSTAEAEKVVGLVTTMGFMEELGEKGKEAFDESELILEFTVAPNDSQPVKYTVVSPKDADHYILKASHFPYYFKVAKSKFDELRKANRLQLVKGKEEKASAEGG